MLPAGAIPLVSSDGSAIHSPPSGLDWSDRKSTRLNSSHSQISYAVFCLNKKNGGLVDDPLRHESASGAVGENPTAPTLKDRHDQVDLQVQHNGELAALLADRAQSMRNAR